MTPGGRRVGRRWGPLIGGLLLPTLRGDTARLLPRLMAELDRRDTDFRSNGGVLSWGMLVSGLGAQAVPALPRIVAFHRSERAALAHKLAMFPGSEEHTLLSYRDPLRASLGVLGQVGRHAPSAVLPYLSELVASGDPREDADLLQALSQLAPVVPDRVTPLLLDWHARRVPSMPGGLSGGLAMLFFQAVAQAGPGGRAARPLVEAWVAACAARPDPPRCELGLSTARQALTVLDRH